MKDRKNKIDRRSFLRTVGAAGLAPVAASLARPSTGGLASAEKTDSNAVPAQQQPDAPKMPRRKLGKSEVKVSTLCLGGNYDLIERQIILRKALESGVTYWDTAHNYAGGNSELGIGKFLEKNPDARNKLFIATKASYAKDIAEVEQRLQLSLKRMNTDYIDLYYGIHPTSEPEQLTDDMGKWAAEAKKRKLIRFFGFSTHTNMPKLLAAAAKLDWIDAIMTVYNFRLRQEPNMQAAIEACHKAGIALVAMKCQAAGPGAKWAKQDVEIETEADKKLVGYFEKRGFTQGQAKIKVVLQDERFSSACVGMENISFLNQNVDAMLNETKLTRSDVRVLDEYAKATCSGYCAGCADICNAALPDAPYISDIMRYLMYYNSYGEHAEAKRLFARIPAEVRRKLPGLDCRLAEARCPQRLPISELVAEAVSKLA
jgi:aryl-alcohol dehydrogenase-like predicted oxidoreductase